MNYILAAIAPIIIILAYIYYRDKWDKEPARKLITALVLGCLTVVPDWFLEGFLSSFLPFFNFSNRLSALYNAFIIASFSEETFKFLAVLLVIWRSRFFDEKYDGIVYAVFVSLGFAMIENILYVFNSGMQTALSRAVTAVPAHALFGVAMGYHLSFARFSLFYKRRNLILALLVPIGLHGVYDFILMSGEPGYFIVFVFYLYFLYRFGLKKINEFSSIHR